jgi:hypothetical protein
MCQAPVASDVAYHANLEYCHFDGFASDLLLKKTRDLGWRRRNRGQDEFLPRGHGAHEWWYPAQHTACGMVL